MQLVCFDTQMLIWGVQRKSQTTQTDMIKKAEIIIQQLDKDKTKIIVPSIVLGEFLLGLPVEQHMSTVNFFKKRFIIAPYDAQAASTFANLWKEYDPDLKSKTDKPGRTFLKADAMIVAIAIAREADCIYSEDPWLKNFAGINIHVNTISQIPIQKDFLDQVDNINQEFQAWENASDQDLINFENNLPDE
jgi:predicted nucleic acid-binding protein